MPICVTGMHRSGTSMVARVLHDLGVDFGPEEQLVPADAHNRDGYWENVRLVELSDAVLEALGGGWDAPPGSPESWDGAELEPLQRRGADLLAELDLAEPWGWKDPRVAVVLGFWRRLLPDLRVVACVRHPLDVALSLQRRGATSPPLALSLWETYNERLLAELPPDERLVVHYDRFLADPLPETRRLADGLGLDAGDEEVERAASAAQQGLRHHGGQPGDLDGISLPAGVQSLYDELCGTGPGGVDAAEGAGVGASLTRTVNLLQERDSLRRRRAGLTRDRDNWLDRARRTTAELEEAREQARVATTRAEELERRLRALEARAGELQHALDAAGAAGETAGSELRELTADLEHAREQERVSGARERQLEIQVHLLEARSEELQRVLDLSDAQHEAAASEIRGLTADRENWRNEAGRLTDDRDNWREEAGRLVDDRNNWRTEAQNWRRETERLMAINERRLSHRLRTAAFRLARVVWWWLPRRLRNILRPIIFKSARPSRPPTAVEAAPRDEPGPTARRSEAPAPLAVTAGPVSVLIPTLNAGPDFARLLAGVAAQEGVEAVELIVVDSGSTDGTPELAEAAGARVVRIGPDEFGHGRTRNQAAELASHDVLVFLVQDALPLGRTVLRDLAAELHAEPRLAGISARQIPRSDADLYGAFVTWSHDHALRAARAELDGSYFEQLDPLGRRAVAALDDVCAAVRRDVWAEFRFRDVGFAEDLDFAVRAASSGWLFGMSDTVAVAHSHDRDSVYHLRRSIADRLYVSPLMNDPVAARTYGWEAAEVLAAASVLLEELCGAVSLAGTGTSSGAYESLAEQLSRIAALLDLDGPRLTATGELARLAEFIEHEGGRAPLDDSPASLGHELNALLRWPPLDRFAAAHSPVEADVLLAFTAKLAASVIGRALGDAARSGASSADVSRLLAGV